MKPSFKCRRCGRCCRESWEIVVDFEKDILRWLRERRFDILKHVVLSPKFILRPERYAHVPQWIIDSGHLLFGKLEHRCPFLVEENEDGIAACAIHDVRPQVCRRFPYDMEGEVRMDVLDLCIGAVLYHARRAEEMGMGLIEYVREQGFEDAQSLLPKSELQWIASAFGSEELKISFTSEQGLRLAGEQIKRLASHQRSSQPQTAISSPFSAKPPRSPL